MNGTFHGDTSAHTPEQNVPNLAELETLDTGLPIHQTKNVLIPREMARTSGWRTNASPAVAP